MKKRVISFLCAATIMIAAIPAYAAGTHNALISPKPAVIAKKEAQTVQYTLKINDKDVDLKNHGTVIINDKVMIPLRITAEALGFTVTWDGKKQAVHMDNGLMQTDLTIGKDNYFAYSSKALGMTAPQSLGAAPTIIKGSVYVPVDFYKIIFHNPNCVTIKDKVISISYAPVRPNTQFINGMPNPLVKYSTLDEARKAIGYDFAVPATLPEGYEMKDIIVISNNLAEVFYMKDDSSILYRTSKGTVDISGDYNEYDNVKTVIVGNAEVTVKGNGDSINLATWSKDGVSYSISFGEAVNEKALSTFIESIK